MYWVDRSTVEIVSEKDKNKPLWAYYEYLRDMDGGLCVYIRKPFKTFDFWKVVGFEKCKSLRMVDIDLPMVKWSDDSPWLIENLKKLEVVDSYE